MPGYRLIHFSEEMMVSWTVPNDSSYKRPSSTLHCCFSSSHIQSFIRFTIHSFIPQFCELTLRHILYRYILHP